MSFSIIEEPKNPEEIHPYGVDFSNGMEIGDSISDKDIEVFDESRVDQTSSMLSGTAQLNGNIVWGLIQAGTDGNKYSVRYTATLSSGAVLQHVLVMAVKDQRR